MSKSKFLVLLGSASLAVMPGVARGQDVIPPKVLTQSPTGVNMADASFTYSVTDIAVGPLKLERSYIGSYAIDPNTMLLGTHQTHSFDIFVTKWVSSPGVNKATAHIGASASGNYYQGTTLIFPSNFDAQSGTLALSSGNYVYTDMNSGVVYTFTSAVSAAGARGVSSQRVSTITFPDGRVQTFSYSSGKLKLVSDSSGYAIVFDYGSNGLTSAACGFDLAQTYVTVSSTCTGAAMKVSYGYSGSLLTSVADIMGQATTYGWSSSTTQIDCVTPPGYSTCKIANTFYGSSISQQTMADGSVWSFTASQSPGSVTDPEDPPCEGCETASYGASNGYGMSGVFTKSTPYSLTDANGNATSYRFTGAKDFYTPGPDMSEGKRLIEADYPEGNKYLAEYNYYGWVTKETLQAKPGSGLADLVKEYNYVSTPCCAKPTWVKDPKGNQTDYTFASWGGTLSEMQPAPTTGAARPLKLTTYVQKYAYVKNSGGTLVAVSTPIWLPDTETVCQTVAGSSTPTCDSGAPQLVTTYLYGANGTADNLLPHGKLVSDGTTSLRTCFGYDSWGRKIFETSPRAGLSSC